MREVLTCKCGCQTWIFTGSTFECTKCEFKIELLEALQKAKEDTD